LPTLGQNRWQTGSTAANSIRTADVVCYIGTKQTSGEFSSQARAIAAQFIPKNATEVAIEMPMSSDRTAANLVYDNAANEIKTHLSQHKKVVYLCEGDPLFFGSYSYLQERLPQQNCLVIPGVTSFSAASAVFGLPLTLLNQSLTVLSGRNTDAELRQYLKEFDNLVIMKAGQARPRILALLKETERFKDAYYIEYASRDNQLFCYNLNELNNSEGPYFSLFLVSCNKMIQ